MQDKHKNYFVKACNPCMPAHTINFLISLVLISFDISGKPLEWLRSFLSGRISCKVFMSIRFHWVATPFSLPQGSVLGPLLYTSHTFMPCFFSCGSCGSSHFHPMPPSRFQCIYIYSSEFTR